MARWLAVGVGCVTALGMQALFTAIVSQTALAGSLWLGYVVLFAALVLGGYVTGHFTPSLPVLYGALAAVLFILVTASFNSIREAAVARQLGLGALPPIDFLQLTVTDVLAMTGASCGGWLASRTRFT